MKKSVMEDHIKMYVNNFSLDLGSEGKNAINRTVQDRKGKRYCA